MGYRETLIAEIIDDNQHPMNCDIPMQIHHLISKKSITNAHLTEDLKQLGYNVNKIGNLVALPSTLQGACHLEVQLHRGNHTTLIDTDDNDKEHGVAYHDYVEQLVIAVLEDIENDCGEKGSLSAQRRLNRKSVTILNDIAAFRLPLSSCYKEFRPNASGCMNCNSLPEMNSEIKKDKVPCSKNRKHSEFFAFPKQQYTLSAGK